MTYKEISCFKAYDVRGIVNENFDRDIVYRIARAFSEHLFAKQIVVGFDSRETSKMFANVVKKALVDSGCDALMIGMAGVEEVYWAVTEFKASGGIEITASHNPKDYNGLKMVKSKSIPLDFENDLMKIKSAAERADWTKVGQKGKVINISTKARNKYIDKVLSFVALNNIGKIKVLVNCGNGALGPTLEELFKKLSKNGIGTNFNVILGDPDHNFPNGVPNPLLKENQAYTSNHVQKINADLGVAFDGDFDRCFFFDERGEFVKGEYIVGLIAEHFLEGSPGARIVHDPRVVWNIEDVVKRNNGDLVLSRTGHSYFKQAMRESGAVYGGEISAHHYYRDFACCDSGVITFLLVLDMISKSGTSLRKLVEARSKIYLSSGEINFKVKDTDFVIAALTKKYSLEAEIDKTDGVSIISKEWRMNIRKSNTEPVLRLNVEALYYNSIVKNRLSEVSGFIAELDA